MENKRTLVKLAFPGNKFKRIREIENLIQDKNYDRIIEVFGGSCCISNNLKRRGIIKTAIANDYDQYFKNFEYKMNLRKELINHLLSLGFTKSKKALPAEKRKIIQELIKPHFQDESLLKYLAKNFVFSAIRSSGIIRLNDFQYFSEGLSCEEDLEYFENLKNITLDSLDFKDFILKYIIKNDPKTLVILDPPYLNTNQKQYDNKTYFSLHETITLLTSMKELKNDFIFFNQDEKNITELLNLMNFNFKSSIKKTLTSANAFRDDFMAYVTFQ